MTFILGVLIGFKLMLLLGFILAVKESKVLRNCEHKYSVSISQFHPQLLLFIECKKCSFTTSYLTDQLILNDKCYFTETNLSPEELEEIRKSKKQCPK